MVTRLIVTVSGSDGDRFCEKGSQAFTCNRWQRILVKTEKVLITLTKDFA